MTPFFIKEISIIFVVFLLFIFLIMLMLSMIRKAVYKRRGMNMVGRYNIIRYKYQLNPEILSKLFCVSTMLILGLILVQFRELSYEYVYLILIITYLIQFPVGKYFGRMGFITLSLLFICLGMLVSAHYYYIAGLEMYIGYRILLFISQCLCLFIFLVIYLKIIKKTNLKNIKTK